MENRQFSILDVNAQLKAPLRLAQRVYLGPQGWLPTGAEILGHSGALRQVSGGSLDSSSSRERLRSLETELPAQLNVRIQPPWTSLAAPADRVLRRTASRGLPDYGLALGQLCKFVFF